MTSTVLILGSLEKYCRYTPTVSHIKHVCCELDYCNGSGDSNFLDLDWLSISDNERFVVHALCYILSSSGPLRRNCNKKNEEPAMYIYR
jgi:hypothetical protein